VHKGDDVPAWSPAIANVFIKMAAADGAAFDQMHLQELVYIAHGWCLALSGQPLTGDRPEAFTHGPEYRRLAESLVNCGVAPILTEIAVAGTGNKVPKTDAVFIDDAGILPDEHAILAKVYAEYGGQDTQRLAIITRAPGTPWAKVYAGGAGIGHDSGPHLIRAQFVMIADEFDA
jgi:uncharacterized phage-associated protein